MSSDFTSTDDVLPPDHVTGRVSSSSETNRENSVVTRSHSARHQVECKEEEVFDMDLNSEIDLDQMEND